MKNEKTLLPYLLPFRSIIFMLIFIVGAFITNKKISEISNWWSIVASLVNIITILILLFVTKKLIIGN